MVENAIQNAEVVADSNGQYVAASRATETKAPITPRLTTEDLAAILRIKPQTVRAGLCRDGHYMGMRPVVKLPNRRLLWDAAQAEAIVNG